MFDSVGIVGLGLIGGSLAKALRPHTKKLIGVDPRVRAPGLIDAAGPLSECELVVLAAPVERIPRLIPSIASQMAPEAVLMDVASVKAPVFDAVLRLKRPVNFISGHPMAGTEQKGFEHSDAGMFQGRPFLLIPGVLSGKRPIRLAEKMARAIGAQPRWLLSPEHHDLALAYVSHAPHVLAYALLASAGSPLKGFYKKNFLREIAGPSFRDATRVASSPPGSVASFLLSNRANILRALADVDGALREFRAVLKKGSRGILLKLLNRIMKP